MCAPTDVPQKTQAHVRVRLLDTPGLNEVDPETEVEHMMQLLKVCLAPSEFFSDFLTLQY